jgi:hypothetical protein
MISRMKKVLKKYPAPAPGFGAKIGRSLMVFLMVWISNGMPIAHSYLDGHHSGFCLENHHCSDHQVECCDSDIVPPQVQIKTNPESHSHPPCPICTFLTHFGKFLSLERAPSFIDAVTIDCHFTVVAAFRPAIPYPPFSPRAPPLFT